MGKSVAGKDIKSSDDMLNVIYHFVKDVIGVEVILAGESYSGYLARGFVNKYQLLVKSIILLCPLVYPGCRNGQVEPLCVMEQDEAFLQTLSEEQYNSVTYMNVVLTKPVWTLYERDILPAIEMRDRHFLDNVLEGAALTKGTPGFEIYEGFEPRQGEKIFDKTVKSSFKGTGLLENLREKNVQAVAVVGLQTDYCIDATIKCGFEHGLKMLVPENANSTFDNAFITGEQSYKYYNEFMWKDRYAECISVKETIELMKNNFKKREIIVNFL